MNDNLEAARQKPGKLGLADYAIPLTHANFNNRVVVHSRDLAPACINQPGVCVRVFEAVETDGARLTLLIDIAPGGSYSLDQHHGGEELLVLSGSICSGGQQHLPGIYLRNPPGTLLQTNSDTGCQLFAKLGEFGAGDEARRCTDIHDNSNWLPGPAEGTEVLPLHGHETRSVMMIRWQHFAEFKPGLDPKGEEIYVVKGRLRDDQGEYPSGSWIRNPIVAWQSWQGDADTLIYYKSGHFPADHG